MLNASSSHHDPKPTLLTAIATFRPSAAFDGVASFARYRAPGPVINKVQGLSDTRSRRPGPVMSMNGSEPPAHAQTAMEIGAVVCARCVDVSAGL
jgi:hypothetical protein